MTGHVLAKWTLDEKKRNPHVCAISRVQAVGGDPSELERAIDSDYVIIAPTVGVQEGRSNPIVRARELKNAERDEKISQKCRAEKLA